MTPARPTPAPAILSSPASAAHASSEYVHPGRFLARGGRPELTTVVGSGVVVCLWDPIASVAGMAHFLLPDKGNASPAPRFGDVAMKSLLDDLIRLGAQAAHLRASVFGGGAPPIATGSGHLGERNVEAANAFLSAQGIPVVQREVGGAGGRKVTLQGATGRVVVNVIGG